MKKEFWQFFLILFFFFFFGIFLCFSLEKRMVYEFQQNNAFLVGTLINEHPELEHEIIEALSHPKNEKEGFEILKKYGLNSIEYIENINQYKKNFYRIFLLFYLLLTLTLIYYFFKEKRKRKEEILKVDRYLFSLLREDIKVDLKDFQSGELESLQNDLMKVTSRLKNALEHSNSASKELSKNLADISHQLKTPLTSLSIINEALLNPEMKKETRLEFVSKQSEVIKHMQTLIINLLKVSQIESGIIELKKENINVNCLLAEILDELEPILLSKNITIQQNDKDDLVIIGDFSWIKEAIMNVVKNGIEHSPENGVIAIQSNITPLYVEISIRDYGCGIPKKDLPHIFERFYKTSKSKDSIGIGLSLSKSILDRMNATIRVSSKINEGTTFTIHFYKSIL